MFTEKWMSFFARLAMAAPLYFAAGATAIAGGDGGAADGGGDDIGGGSDAGAGAGAGDAGATDADAAEAAPGDAEKGEGAEEGKEGKDAEANARAMLEERKKAIAEIRKQNPKLADELKRDFSKARQFEQAFKTPTEAREAKEFMERVGGEDGLAEIEAQLESMKMVDASIERGDPAVVDDMVADFPEGFAKIMPHALEKWEAVDPDGFKRHSASAVDRYFESNNVYSHVDALAQAIADGKQEDAHRLTTQLREFLKGSREFGQRRQNAGTDKEREAFEREKREFEESRRVAADNEFSEKVLAQANAEVTRTAEAVLKDLTRGLEVPAETRARIMREVFREINAKLNELPNYGKRYDALFASRDVNRMAKFIIANARQVLPGLVKSVKSAYILGTGKPAARVAAQRGAGGNGAHAATLGRKPTLAEARAMGFGTDEYLSALGQRKLERNGKVFARW